MSAFSEQLSNLNNEDMDPSSSMMPKVPGLQTASERPGLIKAGFHVLLQLPTPETRLIKLDADGVVNIGRFGSFRAAELIGQPFGLTFDIQADKTLKIAPPKAMLVAEDTDATNELIYDTVVVQPLSVGEIEELKKTSSTSEIIQKQIESHANFALKTEFSKDKYRKRKEAKYSKSFTAIEPSFSNICQFYFAKDPNKIRDIRVDTLGQLLSLANVRPGGRYIVIDDTAGLVAGAVLERLGGKGRILTIGDTESPPNYHVMTCMNFDPELVESVVVSLTWSNIQEDWVPARPKESKTDFKSDKERVRENKRLGVLNHLEQTRTELFAGEFDALIVASQYEPFSIVEKLSPYLGGSASIVVYSPHIQIVSDAQHRMRQLPHYLAPSVTESWLRQYQVYPGRTHPLMTTSGSGGYLLHAIKVYDDGTAESALAGFRQRAKRKKAEAEAAKMQTDEHVVTGNGTPDPQLTS